MKIITGIAAALLLAGCGGGATAEPASTAASTPALASATAAAPSSAAAAEPDPTCDVVARVRTELPELDLGPLDDEMAAQYRGVVTALQLALPDMQSEADALPDSPLAEDYRMALGFMEPQTALYLSQLDDWSISDADGSEQLHEFGAAIIEPFDEILAACPK